MKKILAISVIMLAISAGLFAQATATATAVIVAPISIVQTADMSFGNIIASGATYSISLPLTHNIVSGANNMVVNAFTSTPSGTGTLTGGSEVLNVGATLNVGAAQPAGTYSSAAGFTVTVNYN